MFIDAHQHVWDPTVAEYDWLSDPSLRAVDRVVEYGEYVDGLRAAGGAGSILVQAADNDEDTELMFSTASRHPEVLGVVAYLPLHDTAATERRLAQLRDEPLFSGARTLIHRRQDPDWLLSLAVDASLGLLERAEVTFDVVGVLDRHLEVLRIVAQRHPGLRLVLDHLNKPDVTRPPSALWNDAMGSIADAPNTFAKFSGLYAPDPDPASWTTEGIRPFLTRVIEAFGSDRVMYGSDWPMCILAGGYDRVTAAQLELIGELGAAEQADVLGGTAGRAYGITVPDGIAVK